MSALVCGSLAFDTIMVFPDRFKNHILPDQVHILNVSFLVPEMRREYGGCAGNIAYNLKLLGGDGKPMGTVGRDFDVYRDWMDDCGIDRAHITQLDDSYTAQGYVVTDLDDNQIWAFHPGAMNHSHVNKVPTDADISIGIVAPDGRDGMVQHASQFADADIPFIFDPGQGLPMFDGDDLLRFVEQASWLALNDYESRVMQERTGLSLAQLAERVKAVIVTRGGEGSCVYTEGQEIEIPAAKAQATKDPTGCGDAYRAGLLYGLMNDFDWGTTGRVAALAGAIKIEQYGTQNHRFTQDEFKARYNQAFGHDFA
ncbi:MAG: carbohydrate kinase family protein [Gammaproteobacteria bacterium]